MKLIRRHLPLMAALAVLFTTPLAQAQKTHFDDGGVFDQIYTSGR